MNPFFWTAYFAQEPGHLFYDPEEESWIAFWTHSKRFEPECPEAVRLRLREFVFDKLRELEGSAWVDLNACGSGEVLLREPLEKRGGYDEVEDRVYPEGPEGVYTLRPTFRGFEKILRPWLGKVRLMGLPGEPQNVSALRKTWLLSAVIVIMAPTSIRLATSGLIRKKWKIIGLLSLTPGDHLNTSISRVTIGV